MTISQFRQLAAYNRWANARLGEGQLDRAVARVREVAIGRHGSLTVVCGGRHLKKPSAWGLDRTGGPNLDAAGSEKGGRERMPRRRGAQPGNQNALKHGRYSIPLRAARMAALQAAVKERQQRLDEWIRMVPPTDYGAIVDELRALRAKDSALAEAEAQKSAAGG